MQKNTITEQLATSARRSGHPQVAREVELLVGRGSRAVEDAVCEAARSVGWFATRTRASLPCGDIDALAARKSLDGEVLIVVCEVKDADLHGHRGDAYEGQSRDIAKALKQLDRKAAWVARNWSDGFGSSMFPELGGCEHGIILKLLIFKKRSPLELVNGAECVSLFEVKRFLAELKNSLSPWFEGTRKASVVHF